MTPIQRSIEFASKFSDIITDKMQLQRFLRSLNYISPFYKNFSRDLAPLYDRLKKDHKKPWTTSLTDLVKTIKERVKSLPCLTLANLAWPKIVETNAFNIGMNPPWITKARGKDNYTRGRGRSSPTHEKASSSIHLEDIPESDPLYAKLQEFLTQKQGDCFASIAKEEVDDIKTYEKVEKREMIFLLENSDIQRKEEPWKIFQRYLVNGLYFPSESYKTWKYYETLLISTSVEFQHFSGYNTSENVYNFSKMIIKHVIHIEDWGISSMTERQFSLNKVMIHGVNKLSQFMHRPSHTHWQAVKRLLRYLKSTIHHGLLFHHGSNAALYVYNDADWVGDHDDRTSTSAYVVYLGLTPISWSSKKQVARSSTEAEYRAIAETNWLTNLLKELRISLVNVPTIYCDNIGTTYLCQNPIFHSEGKKMTSNKNEGANSSVVLTPFFDGTDFEYRKIRMRTHLKAKEPDNDGELTTAEMKNLEVKYCQDAKALSKIQMEILISVTEKYEYIVAITEEMKDLSKLFIKELVGSFRAHKKRRFFHEDQPKRQLSSPEQMRILNISQKSTKEELQSKKEAGS
ncbi:hypothetical protein H5410_050738 [Solanum commersonii]|uniref:Uncharacterized protein n=1 Tax=Solanum commersonii TaxID=4109 RepID=A0A9J5WXM3_SOLCO|nr:hypothetical protein H5410_050738 [Solanum commersonii]